MEQLTKQQQDLVERNHNLIFGFAHKKKIDINEYYGILAIGLCKAARLFDDNKGEFSTFAYRSMENELYRYWRHIKSQKFIPNEMMLYYDAEYDNENCNTSGCKATNMLSCLTDNHSTHDIVVSNMMSEKLMSMLKGSEKKIVEYLLIGMQQAEIAEIMNCSRQNVNFAIQQIRRKLTNYFGYSY